MKLHVVAALVLVTPLAVASQPMAAAAPAPSTRPGLIRASASISRASDIIERHRVRAEERRLRVAGAARRHLYRHVAHGACPSTPTPHFATPLEAMTYLAHAWNRRDLAALCHVTNADSRRLLAAMAGEAKHLQVHRCSPNGDGSYGCDFVHEYPRFMHRGGLGRAWLQVAPAARPGWYVTAYEGCG